MALGGAARKPRRPQFRLSVLLPRQLSGVGWRRERVTRHFGYAVSRRDLTLSLRALRQAQEGRVRALRHVRTAENLRAPPSPRPPELVEGPGGERGTKEDRGLVS